MSKYNIKRSLICKHEKGYDKEFSVIINQNVLDENVKINGVKISITNLRKIFETLHVSLVDVKTLEVGKRVKEILEEDKNEQ